MSMWSSDRRLFLLSLMIVWIIMCVLPSNMLTCIASLALFGTLSITSRPSFISPFPSSQHANNSYKHTTETHRYTGKNTWNSKLRCFKKFEEMFPWTDKNDDVTQTHWVLGGLCERHLQAPAAAEPRLQQSFQTDIKSFSFVILGTQTVSFGLHIKCFGFKAALSFSEILRGVVFSKQPEGRNTFFFPSRFNSHSK